MRAQQRDDGGVFERCKWTIAGAPRRARRRQASAAVRRSCRTGAGRAARSRRECRRGRSARRREHLYSLRGERFAARHRVRRDSRRARPAGVTSSTERGVAPCSPGAGDAWIGSSCSLTARRPRRGRCALADHAGELAGARPSWELAAQLLRSNVPRGAHRPLASASSCDDLLHAALRRRGSTNQTPGLHPAVVPVLAARHGGEDRPVGHQILVRLRRDPPAARAVDAQRSRDEEQVGAREGCRATCSLRDPARAPRRRARPPAARSARSTTSAG